MRPLPEARPLVSGLTYWTALAVPGVTVRVPESIETSTPVTAWISADPTRWPVNVALLLSPEGTRSPATTPPLTLASDQLAATLATKFPFASRLMA